VWEQEPAWRQLGRQRHRLQLAFADRMLGETLSTLRQRGLLDQAVVVVTADHGISFAPGTAARILGRGNDAWVMWVPLFIKAPGQTKGRIDDRNWEHVDLLPTLADYAGVRLPWPVDGRSAVRGEPRTETSKHFVAVREHGNPKQFTIAGPQPGRRPQGRRAAAPPGGAPAARGRVRAGTGPSRPPGRPGGPGPPRPPSDRRRPRPHRRRAGRLPQRPADRGEVPAYVQGTVPAGVAPGTLLALAVEAGGLRRLPLKGS
jgi:Sulfatase